MLRYRHLREAPVDTLDRICAFLGVSQGVLDEMPAENVTTHASSTAANRALGTTLRGLHAVEHRLPRRWWPRIDAVLARALQNEQRPRQALTAQQRSELIPGFVDDVAVLERLTGESFGDWLDPNGPAPRTALRPTGRIGTAFGSIDRPLHTRDEHAGSAPASPLETGRKSS